MVNMFKPWCRDDSFADKQNVAPEGWKAFVALKLDVEMSAFADKHNVAPEGWKVFVALKLDVEMSAFANKHNVAPEGWKVEGWKV